MFRKLLLVIYLFNEIIFRDIEGVTAINLFSQPDLSNPLCGLRNVPIKIKYPNKCFAKSYEDRLVLSPIKPPIRSKPSNRVIWGWNVRHRESPWTVQITKREGRIHWDMCTGVLITMQHILTAAHCWEDNLGWMVYAGSDKTRTGWSSSKGEFLIHPEYWKTLNNGTLIGRPEFDLAIIKLVEPIDLDKYGKNEMSAQFLINTICLPQLEKTDSDQDDYREATFFGWGITTTGEYPNHLQRVNLHVAYDLFRQFKYFISRRPRSCSGDSGSGLIQYLDDYEERAVLIGILIRSKNKFQNPRLCHPEDIEYSIAVRVSLHLKWINRIINGEKQ